MGSKTESTSQSSEVMVNIKDEKWLDQKQNVGMYLKLEKDNPDDASTGWEKKLDYRDYDRNGVCLSIY